MNKKTNSLKNLIIVLPTILVLGIVAGPADAANPSLLSAKYISDTELKMIFDITLDVANTVDETKITITNNSGTVITITDNSAIVVGNSLTITTASVGGSTEFKIDDNAQGLDLAADAVKDSATSGRNIEDLNNSVSDGQKPTFTAARTDLNTILLSFSEPVTGTTIANSFTVAGASSVTNTAPTANTTITLTTVGLNATNGTPSVNYVAATGNIVDNADTPNEIANGGAIVAADQVPPTFTASRTALNTIVLTFSETVSGTAFADSFTVAGASSVINTAPTANPTITLTTVGLTATNGTLNVSYNATAGDIIDNAAIPNEIANGGAIAAADQVPPTFTASRTALNTIVLSFSEPVSGTAIVNSFTVAGASSVINTAPTANTTITLTTVGLTSTNGTPGVGYNATAGDIADNSAAQNEIANGGAIAAADQVPPTFTASRTALNTIVLTFSEPVTGTALVDSFTVSGASSVINTAPTANTTITLTTVGLTATNGTPNVVYNATAGNIADNSAAQNEIADGGAIAAADMISPTFTAARTALNTIVLSFSEPVTGTTLADSFTVAGASSVTNTAPTTNTTITLTTVGLTSTNGAPNVSYNATTGDIADNSVAQNEIAEGEAIAAADQVPPIVTYATLNYNTALLNITFSETIYTNLTNASKFHLNNISGTNIVNLTDATTTVTNGTILSFTLTEAQRYGAFNISGVNGGDGGAVVLDLDAAGVTDLENNANDADLDNTVTETYTAANTTAVISLNSAAYLSGTATVSVNDWDMNTISGSNQTLTLNLTSSTTLANLTLTLTETDVNTGIFNGTFTFGSASSGTTLGISDGDTIYANYTDNDSVLRSTCATFNALAAKLVINSTTYGNLIDMNGTDVFPGTMVAGVAAVFNINATDANGVLDTGFNGTMTISVNGSGTPNPISYTFVAANNGTKSISVTDNVSESIVIYFNSTSVGTNASTIQAVVPNKPFKLLFNSSMPLSTLTNSLRVNISLTDEYNNLINVSKLTGENGTQTDSTKFGGTDGLGLGVQFSVGLTKTGGATISPSTVLLNNTTVNTYVAYVNDSSDETLTLRASASGFSNSPITTNISFLGAVSNLLVSTNKTNNTAHANGGANALGSINISAQLRDASGNALFVPDTVVTFDSMSTAVLNIVAQTATTDACGMATITVSTTNVAGTALIEARDNEGNIGMVTVTTTAIVDNANSELVVDPAARAGDNVSVYATLYDYAGTVMPSGTTVSFSITSGDSTSTLNNIEKGTIVTAYTNGTGIATVTFRSTNISAGGVHTINATVLDESNVTRRVGSSEQTIIVSPNDAAVLVVLPASKGLANIKGTNATFNVTIYDAYNNVNTTGPIKVNVSTTDTDLGNMTAGSTVVNNYAIITTSNGIGSMLYTINSTNAGTATLTFAVNKNETGQLPGLLNNFIDNVLVTTNGATGIVITFNETVQDIGNYVLASAQLTDSSGNALDLSDTKINFVVKNAADLIQSVSTSATNANGLAIYNFTQSVAGVYTVTATNASLGLSNSTTVTFAGSAASIVVTANNSSPQVNGTIRINATVRDSSGVTSASLGAGTITFLANGIVFASSSLSSGMSSTTYTSATAGPVTITAFHNASLQNTTTVNFMAAVLLALTVTASSVNVTAGTAEDVTFTVSPALSGVLVTLSGAGVSMNGTTTNGSVTIEDVTAKSPGTILVTSSLSGYTDGTTNITAEAAPPVIGNDTVGIYRTGGAFYLRNSNSAGNADMAFVYGITSDIPLVGDWDGNGNDTVGIYRNGSFYLKNSNSAGNADLAFIYGVDGDIPLVGDWNGDGVDTVGIYRHGSFYLKNNNSAGNADIAFIYGVDGDIPLVGDWNGDGNDTVGIYRNGSFYLRNSNDAGIADLAFIYGITGDTPLVGDWTGVGIETIGIYRDGAFYLRNSNSAGNADNAFIYGVTGDTPIAGDWDGQ